MKIYYFLKRILNYLCVLDFSFLKKNNIIIYSGLSFYELDQIFKYKYQIMDIPSKKINIFILIKMILKFKFKKIDYFYFFIKKINPKILISTYDNDINVYNLKKKFPQIKFILIQNGRRGGVYDIFNNEFKKSLKKKFFIDHFFVFGSAIEKKYKEFINGKFHNIGSIRNNLIKIKNKNENKKKLVFISQFRPEFPIFFKYHNKIIDYQSYYESSIRLFKLVEEFCFKNNIKLLILPSINKNNIYSKEEKKFFEKLSKHNKYKLLEKNTNLDSYKIINQYEIFFGQDSTLIYEALSRNKRIGSFSRIKNISLYTFTWPLRHSNKGYFFSNNVSNNEIKRIYRNITKINEKNWLKKIEFYKKNFMCFNYDNTKIKNLIKKEINGYN